MPILRAVGQLCLVLLDRSNIVVTATVAAFVLYTRSAGMAYFALSSVACAMVAKGLKLVVRQARPAAELVMARRVKKSYGMPSTHSAVATFQCIYGVLASLYLPIHPSLPLRESDRWLPVLIIVPWAVSIIVSRIQMGYHTWPQVLAGISCGVPSAVLAFSAWTSGLNVHGQQLERLIASYISA
ncbi:hypothetical protein FA15DRAFT_630648 [Coprinopsis marcescibilis]|uniref:Phosphatidic acid phosphatase type 2/haloperoxidase domain-containing protein n=1 Tax=Coprinopsis marcescibilis TaxID=230819 RepID=A0A5C3LB63_COPMA|nr:hypothetical protein FA15DRAFT_630648 [Coprinopsis marcescibilis]